MKERLAIFQSLHHTTDSIFGLALPNYKKMACKNLIYPFNNTLIIFLEVD